MKSRANFVERVGVLKDLGVMTCCLALTFLVIENHDFVSAQSSFVRFDISLGVQS